MWNLYRILFGFLQLYAEDPNSGGGGEDTDVDVDPDPDADPDADPDLKDEPEPEPEPEHDDKAENMAALRKARQTEAEARHRAEVELAAERGRREALEAASRPAPKDDEPPADADEMTKWAHAQSKVIRTNAENSNRALAIAMDTADRAEFYSRAAQNPLIGKYGPQVEDMLRKTRAAGGNAQRDLIFKVILGEAVLNAKEKGAGKKAKDAAAARVTEARGKPGSVRSDASGKERKSDLQKLEDKLRDLSI
jgi:hypothetical protein